MSGGKWYMFVNYEINQRVSANVGNGGYTLNSGIILIPALSGAPDVRKLLKVTSIKKPSLTFWFADSRPMDNWSPAGKRCGYETCPSLDLKISFADEGDSSDWNISGRHNKTANLLFFDGHVKAYNHGTYSSSELLSSWDGNF
jgi:prepilin-type processing-associated H-X9-DG protein